MASAFARHFDNAPIPAGEAEPFLEEMIAVNPLEAGEAALRADAAPLVLLGMINAGLTVHDLRLGIELAGVDVDTRRWRRSWARSAGLVALTAIDG